MSGSSKTYTVFVVISAMALISMAKLSSDWFSESIQIKERVENSRLKAPVLTASDSAFIILKSLRSQINYD